VTVEAAAENFVADRRAAYPLGLQYLQSVPARGEVAEWLKALAC
jgi:hypothetical protein